MLILPHGRSRAFSVLVKPLNWRGFPAYEVLAHTFGLYKCNDNAIGVRAIGKSLPIPESDPQCLPLGSDRTTVVLACRRPA
jgi:hypothetical protein